jgi:hypothetical protein
MGLGLMYPNYLPSGRAFYCPSMKETEWGGYRYQMFDGDWREGWNPTGGAPRTCHYARASYYYRYAFGAPVKGLLKMCGAERVDLLRADIDYLSRYCRAAAWSAYHVRASVPGSCCGDLNPGYHKNGYNVLFYSSEVLFMPASRWPWFPGNVDWDGTDGHTCQSGGANQFQNYADPLRR